jgi:hypothetical protein
VPTYEKTATCLSDWDGLSESDQKAFLVALQKFIADLRAGKFRRGLRVKRVEGTDVFEMTWADDGRATFEYGPEVRNGEAHIVWRRIGGHLILRRP